MPGVNAGCSKSEQDCEDDALEILKSCMKFDEVPNSSGDVAVDGNNLLVPVNSFEHQLMFGHSSPAKIDTEDQLSLKSETVVHSGDTDSSDDEYSDYGKILKKMLVEKQEPCKEYVLPANHSSYRQKSSASTNVPSAFHTETLPQPASDVYTDSVFGIRIINRLVSSTLLKEKMQDRAAVPLARLKHHVATGKVSSDWVIAGVVIQKSCLKTSQKGSQYYIWKLSDLKQDLKTFSLFLFRAAANELWKTSEGRVIAVLNPNILENRSNSGDEAALSVDNAQRVLILGTSKDLGICKAMKKNGGRCTVFVNKNTCEFCVYHLKQEYQKCSKRTELNSPGRSGLVNIRNKVLGKNEVFYAGKSFTAVPAKRNVKQHQKDEQRLKCLSLNRTSGGSIPPTRFGGMVLPHSQKPPTQEQCDAERLRKLKQGSEAPCSTQGSPKYDVQSISETKSLPVMKVEANSEKVKNLISTTEQLKKFAMPGDGTSLKPLKLEVPKISATSGSHIDLSVPASKVEREQAKINAKKWIKLHGRLKKSDPNGVRGDKSIGKKRKIENTRGTGVVGALSSGYQGSDSRPGLPQNTGESTPKLLKDVFSSSKFQELMKATSKHTHLLQANDEVVQDQYFEKLEKKEQLELKMMETYKVPCKAIQCAKCNYIAFGPSELCKSESHTLRSVNTFKRFFKCGHCSNRTMTLDLVPLQVCKNCGRSRWERAPMLKDTKQNLLVESLSLRGDEEMFVGSVAREANLNLMVPN